MTTDKGGQWWTRSWNVVRGCSPVGAGCDHCWAARMAARFSRDAGQRLNLNKGERGFRNIPAGPFHGIAEFDVEGNPRWTRRVELVESMLEAPLHWRKPQVIAVSLMGDWCHENLPDEARDRIFAVMALCPQHTFITLTKRWQGQTEYFHRVIVEDGEDCDTRFRVLEQARGLRSPHLNSDERRVLMKQWQWPLPNVILGASAWDQASADEAWRWLSQTPAARRLLCLEPLLGPVDLRQHLGGPDADGRCLRYWVIVGAETGPGARPCEWGWIRSVVQQCKAAGVPVWVKALLDDKGRKVPFENWPQGLRLRKRHEVTPGRTGTVRPRNSRSPAPTPGRPPGCRGPLHDAD